MLIKSLPKIYKSASQPYLITLYSAMLATAYFGLFRISEITYSPHVVKAVDVHIGLNKKKLMFVLHTSKTHGRDSKPQIIKIKEKGRETSTGHAICPFELLKKYLKVRQSRKELQELFFVFRDWSPVKVQQFRNLLKRLLSINGIDNRLYS